MNGILYFSSTGNSFFVAQMIQKHLGGEIRYIPSYQGNGSEYDKLMIACPIYSCGLPYHVFTLLPRLRGREVCMILTYGGMVAGADRLAYEYATEYGVNVQGIYTVKMVENFTLSFSTVPVLNKMTLRGVPAKVEKILASIAKNEICIPREKKTLRKKHEQNRSNWHLIAKDFSVTEDCIQCGKCVGVCPSNNITMEKGKVRFGDGCVACLGCYHRCPQKAIRYKNKNKSDRYLHPNVKESDLGKDVL